MYCIIVSISGPTCPQEIMRVEPPLYIKVQRMHIRCDVAT